MTAKKDEQVECSMCQRVYDTTKAFQNHLKSRNHLQKLASLNPGDEPAGTDEIQHLAAVASQIENLKISNSDTSSSDSASGSEEELEDDGDEDYHEFEEQTCLFCLFDSEDLDSNITHMQTSHGLFIPNLTKLTDPYSFFAYLNTLIIRFNECLGCGRVMAGSEAVRDHMKDKGHCMVDVEGEEFRDFYEEDGDDEKKGKNRESLRAEGDKFSLLSGKIVGHRAYREARHRNRAQITVSSETEDPGMERRLVSRSTREMGLIGLSDVQKKQLRTVERKMMRVEMRARNEFRAGLEKDGNKQKHFRNDVPGPRLG
jgi:pre-60S factor REI1